MYTSKYNQIGKVKCKIVSLLILQTPNGRIYIISNSLKYTWQESCF